jgi:hypothetical protein
MNAADIWWIGLFVAGGALWAIGAAWRGYIWKRIDGESVMANAAALQHSQLVMLIGGLLICAGIGGAGAVGLAR